MELKQHGFSLQELVLTTAEERSFFVEWLNKQAQKQRDQSGQANAPKNPTLGPHMNK
jgi:hypothetical protein